MTTRRDFLRKAAAGTAMLSFGGVLEGFSAKSYNNIVGANEKIKVGAIGVNSRGLALATNFAKMEDCEVICACDVDSRAVEKCAAAVSKIGGNKVKTYKDLRSMLENKDVDAVLIATPDHWHAPAALLAIKAGKDVYLEKPCSHSPEEGEILIKGAGGVDGAAGVDGVAHDVSPVPLGLKSPEGRSGFDFERACDRSAALPRPEGRVTLRADRSFAVFATLFGEFEACHRHPPVGVGDGFERRLTLADYGHRGDDLLSEGLVEAVELVAQLRKVAHLLRSALCYNVAPKLCKHWFYLL